MRLWTVADVMTRDVATVSAETSYRQIVDILSELRISAVPVVDAAGLVLGVVSETDLLYKIETEGHPGTRQIFGSRRRRAAWTKATAVEAKDLMTVPAITIRPSALILTAARRMNARHVKRLVVVNDLGRAVGVVTRGDLLKVHLRPDADIGRDVTNGVLHRILAIRDGTVRVEVRDGVVTLTGTLDRRSTAVSAARLSLAVAGVVAVEDHLTFDADDTVLTHAAPGGA
ncbi:CBS domain-containing protein [Plantactinospora sp. KLBMP9567]|uniref:CBS domain-containing protein n=1 Tax=Plantactinospora sp. KLBMP9567 TaxID=3085900 RepID=UPI0029812962|nr:CBS domain-containing protein [Plantactinospora sp. KLBMP9567]MDW5330438.1 CBS domain-containing protein [Plantactinospora sp. KLBMP9567]